jgi:hypothetical protein
MHSVHIEAPSLLLSSIRYTLCVHNYQPGVAIKLHANRTRKRKVVQRVEYQYQWLLARARDGAHGILRSLAKTSLLEPFTPFHRYIVCS